MSHPMLEWLHQFTDEFMEQTSDKTKSTSVKFVKTTGTYLEHLPKDIGIEKSVDGNYFVVFGSRRFRKQKEIRRIFEKFACNLEAVSIVSECHTLTDEEHFVLELVTKHCTDSLSYLRMEWIKIPEILVINLKPIFRQLQTLHLKYVHIPSDKSLFDKLDSLVELTVCNVINCGSILDKKFRKLERFTYENIEMLASIIDQEEQILSTFISRHETLKKLQLQFQCDDSYQMMILQVIGKSCKRLEELLVRMEGTSVSSCQPLQTLKSLKILLLQNVTFEDFKLFSALTELRELHLIKCHTPDDLNEFSCLTQLTNLSLCYGYLSVQPDVVGIIDRLINLEEFEISGGNYGRTGQSFSLDEETFFEIIRIYKARPKVLTLKCKFYFAVNDYGEDAPVRLLALKAD